MIQSSRIDDPPPQQDPKLPPLYAHGDPDPRPLKAWLIKHLIPACRAWPAERPVGHRQDLRCVRSGGRTRDRAAVPGSSVKRQCGVLLIAAEGADEVRLRLDAVVRDKCGGMERAPFRWYETAPVLLQKGAVEKLIAMARQAEDSLQQEFGLPLGLIVIDTIAACAGYARAGDENDPAAGQAIMNVLKAVAQALGCFVLGVDHFGKNLEAGTRGASSKEAAGDLVLACLGDKELSGSVIEHTAGGAEEPGRPAGPGISRSPCASWRRRSRTRTASRSPPWWWTGCQYRRAAVSAAGAGSLGARPPPGSAHGGAAAEAGADGRPGRARR